MAKNDWQLRVEDLTPQDWTKIALCSQSGIAECMQEPAAERDKRRLQKTEDGFITVGEFQRNA